jgi:hypothetical protein
MLDKRYGVSRYWLTPLTFIAQVKYNNDLFNFTISTFVQLSPMKINIRKQYYLLSLLLNVVCALVVAGCSDKEEANEIAKPSAGQERPVTSSAPVFDHAHGPEVTDMQKHKFEHDYAAQCADRELNNSANKIEDAERINKSCSCIAAYMMKDLTAQEAEKFLTEKEHPHSLRIKFDAAAYECLQEKAKPPGPKLFGKPEPAATNETPE